MIAQVENLQEDQQKQMEPVILNLTLNFDQVNAVVAALGRLPTESGVWPLREIIIQQANSQLEVLSTQKTEEETDSSDSTAE